MSSAAVYICSNKDVLIQLEIVCVRVYKLNFLFCCCCWFVSFKFQRGNCHWPFVLAIFQPRHLDRCCGTLSGNSSMARSPFHVIFGIDRNRWTIACSSESGWCSGIVDRTVHRMAIAFPIPLGSLLSASCLNFFKIWNRENHKNDSIVRSISFQCFECDSHRENLFTKTIRQNGLVRNKRHCSILTGLFSKKKNFNWELMPICLFPTADDSDVLFL